MTFLILIAFAAISFIQNMAHTYSSRSRNSGDPSHHRRAAWFSNGVWMINQIFFVKIIFEPVMSGSWLTVLVAFIVYIISTTEGSVFMMRLMLGRVDVPWLKRLFEERGSRQVGSRNTQAK